jgi:hypothetical protein
MALHALENDPEYLNLQTEMVWMQLWLKKEKQIPYEKLRR